MGMAKSTYYFELSKRDVVAEKNEIYVYAGKNGKYTITATTEDGLYSGMVMENLNQYLVLLPIDNDRIDEILRNGLFPFLNERMVSDEIH